MTAGRAAGVVTLALLWTCIAAYVWPSLRAARGTRRRRRAVDALIPDRPWQRELAPPVRVLPARTATASTTPPSPRRQASIPYQRRIS